MLKLRHYLLFLTYPSLSFSQQTAPEKYDFQSNFLYMLFILGLIVAFMFFTSHLLKKMMKARISQVNDSSQIKILETRQLSTKSHLYLVEVSSQKFIISESQTGACAITALHQLDSHSSHPLEP